MYGSDFHSGTKLLKEYMAAQQQATAGDALDDADEGMGAADDDATMNDAAAYVQRLTGHAHVEALLVDVELEEAAAIRAAEVYAADLAVVQAEAQADADLALAQAQAERQAAADNIAQAAEVPLNHRAPVHTKYGTVSWYARRGMDYKNAPPTKAYLSQRLPGSDGSCTYNPKSLSPLMLEDPEMQKVAGLVKELMSVRSSFSHSQPSYAATVSAVVNSGFLSPRAATTLKKHGGTVPKGLKFMEDLGLGVKMYTYHLCSDTSCPHIYRNETKDLDHCPHLDCAKPRYKENRDAKGTLLPHRKMFYLSIHEWLEWLKNHPGLAKGGALRWHSDRSTPSDGTQQDVYDGQLWKEFCDDPQMNGMYVLSLCPYLVDSLCWALL
jgi:hypothetical protein